MRNFNNSFENFNDSGFVFIKSFLGKKELDDISSQFYSLLKMQATKLNISLDISESKGKIEFAISDLAQKINSLSKNAYDQVKSKTYLKYYTRIIFSFLFNNYG